MKKNVMIVVLLVLISVGGSIFMKWDDFGVKPEIQFKENWSIKQIAKANNVKIKKILHLLSHEDLTIWKLVREVEKLEMPITELGLEPNEVQKALEHINEDRNPVIEVVKLSLWAVWLGVIVIVFLTRKNIWKIRWLILIGVVLVFGEIMGASPNPMEAIVKFVKFIEGIETSTLTIVITMVIFTLMSLIGRKFLCSWGCHLGAMQELLYDIPMMKRVKKRLRIPFVLSLTIRVLFFVVFFLMVFGLVFGIKDVITHHVNYFKVFTWSDIASFAMYTLPILFLLSFVVFRPYCQFVCPFGLWAWLFENFAINKIRIDEEKCIHCEKCVKVCPTDAMKVIYAGKRKCFVPDCWSCGACVTVCPTDAVSFAGTLQTKSKEKD